MSEYLGKFPQGAQEALAEAGRVMDSIVPAAIHDLRMLEESLTMQTNGGDEFAAADYVDHLESENLELFEHRALKLRYFGEDTKELARRMGIDGTFTDVFWDDVLLNSPRQVQRRWLANDVSIDYVIEDQSQR